MEGDQSLEDPSPVGTLGTLYLLKRSTGEKIQGFPIDAERITIGRWAKRSVSHAKERRVSWQTDRAEDCDVRHDEPCSTTDQLIGFRFGSIYRTCPSFIVTLFSIWIRVLWVLSIPPLIPSCWWIVGNDERTRGQRDLSRENKRIQQFAHDSIQSASFHRTRQRGHHKAAQKAVQVRIRLWSRKRGDTPACLTDQNVTDEDISTCQTKSVA